MAADRPAANADLIGHSTLNLFNRLDEVLHQRTRLALLCALSWNGELDFNQLRSTLGLSDGNLARHITVLQAADLVETDKRTDGHRRRTYISLTPLGEASLDSHLRILGEISETHRGQSDARPSVAG
ncbi:MAG TPA: transcriptional regulator [Acidimicrobiales bacterium]|nr:transcriptional regulator [Acidimicrobiales bacterium]